MRKFLVPTALVVLCLLIGMLATQAQLRDVSLRETSWRDRIDGGLPDDEIGDDESDDAGDDCSPYLAPVPTTGQTECWPVEAPWSDPIDCGGTGQDGDYQQGVSVDPRFTDRGDGTVKDNLTGLIWLRDAGCVGARTWAEALSAANALAEGPCGLTDGSAAGDWRLPNLKELLSLIDYGQQYAALPPDHPFSAVQPLYYWSSTNWSDAPGYAWRVGLVYGRNDGEFKNFTNYVWPVRGGQ